MIYGEWDNNMSMSVAGLKNPILPDMYEEANEEVHSCIGSVLLLMGLILGKYLDFIISNEDSGSIFTSLLESLFDILDAWSKIGIKKWKLYLNPIQLLYLSLSNMLEYSPWNDDIPSIFDGVSFDIGRVSSFNTFGTYNQNQK